MTDRFESLENGEVLSVQHDTQVLSGHRTFRVGELSEAIKAHLEKAISDWNQANDGWFSPQGMDCEALRFGSQGWQKGRVRLCLEFCPDEPNLLAEHMATSISPPPTAISATTEPMGQAISPPPTAISATTEPMGQAISPPPTAISATTEPIERVSLSTPPSSIPATVETSAEATVTAVASPVATTHDDRVDIVATQIEIAPPAVADTDLHSSDVVAAIPLAGIATIGAVAVATIAAPVHETIMSTHAETTLELEQPTDSGINSGGFDEIAFDFDLADRDRGIMIPNGMMELDLADLGLDFSEHDLLSFEENEMFTSSAEFVNLQDLERPENSGMLIDEVWNEMNQGNNWPEIN